jgi:hypothetical protein
MFYLVSGLLCDHETRSAGRLDRLARRLPYQPPEPIVDDDIPDDQAGARKVPVQQVRRRVRITVAAALTGLAAVWLGPVLALRPMANPAPLAFSIGVVVALSANLIQAMCFARGSQRLISAGARFLTVRTWTGARTIDLRHLRRVRARALGGRLGTFSYLIVTDSAGVSIAFDKPQDLKVIRQALQSQASNHHSPTVKVSRLARSVLDTDPQPRRASFMTGLATFFIGLVTTELWFLFAMAITITTIQIAGR